MCASPTAAPTTLTSAMMSLKRSGERDTTTGRGSICLWSQIHLRYCYAHSITSGTTPLFICSYGILFIRGGISFFNFNRSFHVLAPHPHHFFVVVLFVFFVFFVLFVVARSFHLQIHYQHRTLIIIIILIHFAKSVYTTQHHKKQGRLYYLASLCTILALMAHTVQSACVMMTVGFKVRMRSSSRVYKPSPDVIDSVTNLSTSAKTESETLNTEVRGQSGEDLTDGSDFKSSINGFRVLSQAPYSELHLGFYFSTPFKVLRL